MKNRPSEWMNSKGLKFGIAFIGGVHMLIASGCSKEEIHSYRVPREVEQTAPAAAQQQPASTPDESATVTWAIPEGWQEVETTSSMRIATFQTPPGLEIAVTSFPGDVGGLVANVNRWRGQVGLDPVDEAGVAEAIEQVEGVGGGGVTVVDVAGADARLLGTIIGVGDGNTWFVKTVGPSDVVEQVKADLISFSATFHLHADDHDHSAHQSSEPVVQTPKPVVEDPAIPSNWKKPESWRVDPDASPILMGAYFGEGGARVTLTALTGQGREVLSNINRWRGQLGLEVVASMDDQESKDLGGGAVFVDMVSPDGGSRMAAGIVPVGVQSLFFKMTGTVPEVEEELERFAAFIDEVGVQRMGEP